MGDRYQVVCSGFFGSVEELFAVALRFDVMDPMVVDGLRLCRECRFESVVSGVTGRYGMMRR